MKQNFNKGTTSELEVLTRIQEEQITSNSGNASYTTGGVPISSTDLMDAVQARTTRIAEIRERRLQYFQNQYISTEDSTTTVDLCIQNRGVRSSVLNNESSSSMQEMPIYESYTNFFHRDLFGRPRVLNVQSQDNESLDNVINRVIEQGAIRQPQSLDNSGSLVLLRLREQLMTSINDLRIVSRESFVTYQNQARQVASISNISVVYGLDSLEMGLYSVLSLIPSSVLVYIISNLEVTSAVQMVGVNSYIFIGGMLELLRPFILTVTNVRFWISNTTEELRQSILRVINVIRLERNRVNQSLHPSGQIGVSLNRIREGFYQEIERINRGIQRDISNIRSHRLWSNGFLRSSLLTAIFGLGVIIVSNPQSFWYVISLGLRAFRFFPNNLLNFLTYPFLQDSSTIHLVDTEYIRTFTRDMRDQIVTFNPQGFDQTLREVIHILCNFFY